MVNSRSEERSVGNVGVCQMMLPCARICFLSAPFYGSSHTGVTNTIMWRFPTLFASNCLLGKESWRAFRDRLLPRRALQASPVPGAYYDSLAHYASLTTFGHFMVNS